MVVVSWNQEGFLPLNKIQHEWNQQGANYGTNIFLRIVCHGVEAH